MAFLKAPPHVSWPSCPRQSCVLLPLRKSTLRLKLVGCTASSSSPREVGGVGNVNTVVVPANVLVPSVSSQYTYTLNGLNSAANSDVVGVAVRAVQLAWAAACTLSNKTLDEWQGMQDDPARVQVRATQLREVATSLGPTFIKLAQFLANRPDVVRADYMDELMKLQDDVPPFSHDVAMQILKEDLNIKSLDEIFVPPFPTKPVAAASIGVVYRAMMHAPNDDSEPVEVAVKIQRPNLRSTILRDLWLFRYGAVRWLDGASRARLGCEASVVVDEFGRSLLRELDFNAEARSLAAFQANFEHDGEVVIPSLPFPQCNSPRVLIMSWVDGVRLTDVAAVRDAAIDVDRFISTGVRAGMTQLLEYGLFHGDPHPGNVFAMRDNGIAYIDFGNVSELSKEDQSALLDALIGCMNEDYVRLTKALQELGFLSDDEEVRQRVSDALRRVWIEVAGQGRFDAGALAEDFSFRKITDQFSKLMYDYPLRVPERFAIIIRTLLTQEGICMQLDPKFRFLNVAYPHVARMLLTDKLYTRRLADVLVKSPNAAADDDDDDVNAIAPGELDWARLWQLIGFARSGAGGGIFSLLPTMLKGAWAVFSDAWLLGRLVKAAALSAVNSVARGLRRILHGRGRRRGQQHDALTPAPA